MRPPSARNPDAGRIFRPRAFSSYTTYAYNHSQQRQRRIQDQRLHLHGGIALDHNVVPRAGEALKKAGGDWTNIFGRQFQLKLKPQHAPDGWAVYSLKGRGFTNKVIATDALVFIPNDLRGHAKRLLKTERRRQDVDVSESATSSDEISMAVSLTGDMSPSETQQHRDVGGERSGGAAPGSAAGRPFQR